MALDAVCLSAVLGEMRPALMGARVDKIHQPAPDKVLITLRGQGEKLRLLLVAGGGDSRVHLTQKPYENPQTPSAFCMQLRKHLIGARITKLHQPPLERVARLDFETYQDGQIHSRRALVSELIGKSGNLILLDETDTILGALRRIDGDRTEKRCIVSGLMYRLPDAQGKRNPLKTTRIQIADLLCNVPPDTRADKWLQETFLGLAPLVCREIADRALGETDARLCAVTDAHLETFADACAAFFAEIAAGEFTPYLLTEDALPIAFAYMPIYQYGNRRTLTKFGNFSALLDDFYEMRDRESLLRQRAGDLCKTIANLETRTRRKLAAQTQELRMAQERDVFRQKGEILTANLHRMVRGDTCITAQNFYDEAGGEITIELDPLKTPAQNAAAYFKRYNKAKTAVNHLLAQIEKGDALLAYLAGVQISIETADSAADIAEIRIELAENGIGKRPASTTRGGKKKPKPPQAKPLRFRSTAGLCIYVGKNNTQNDKLTFKTANRYDIWLHAQGIPGSHVMIALEGAPPDERTLKEAASLAALYSRAKADGGEIPVDYTLVKHVKKQPGGKPGMVTYSNQKTIFVAPDAALRDILQQNT